MIDGSRAVDHAKQLAAVFPQREDALLTRAVGNWAAKDSQAALDWIREELGDSVKRDAIGGDVLEALGEKDPVAALDQVGLIDNPDRLREVRYNTFWGWAQQQPERAADYFEKSGFGAVGMRRRCSRSASRSHATFRSGRSRWRATSKIRKSVTNSTSAFSAVPDTVVTSL